MAGFRWFWDAMGGKNTRNQTKSKNIVAQAAKRGVQFASLSDADVVARAHECAQHSDDESRADLLALLSIGAQRSLSMNPFNVQLQAVLRILEGDVIHMATGEGKTLVGAMASVGYALQGKRVHSITVNDYLAERDAEWMGDLVRYFGLTVSAVTESLNTEQRRRAYASSIVYAPVTEIGFDVLRDQLVTQRSHAVQNGADVAIVDEADSVLIDEALVPLVLAGNEPGTAPAGRITEIVRRLKENEHYSVDADRRNVSLNDKGAALLEQVLGIQSLYDDAHVGTTLVQVNLALHAQALLIRDVHYIIRDGKIALIDASKGRVAQLQRWPDGVQAAVEAKEGLVVTEGGRILDTLTLQSLMGRYPIVCGMTGTAVEATDQLRQFYDLRVSVIEPHKQSQRFDEADRVYATQAEKFRALVKEIELLHTTGQPVLIGTSDVSESEELAQALQARDITVNVLNAKNDAEEAQIIAEAGDIGRVTVSTQMAGRGTDIRLGGANEKDRDAVVAKGGLAVIGSSRHRSSRLDNQLRGRAGRQGDPGLSLFFVSLEDDVVVVGGAGEEIKALPDADGRIDSKRITDFVAHCQRVTEGQLLEIHSQTWKYNKLLADQRVIIDERRARLLDTDQAWVELSEAVPEKAHKLSDKLDPAILVQAAREVMLYHLDRCWSDHLALMDHVRESIHLRTIARETPLDEYHRIAVREFKQLAQRAVDLAVETFRDVTIDQDGAHLADAGLTRPSATWTYMVSDNPLSNNNRSVINGIGSIFR
ncbi:accessory Sec system translocase SecA2 [Corynebacterium diphtheriae bv. mitis]|uniref:accessory Sec system translocase SecA2 n=1 Tax=Corynebacterium diphtheriae TaxID=1717 RepID=UPI0002E09550|nr:accessory Sec system translocase SecA2 [Corynebacterium diphtheriae]MBG9359295.1 accessory Sec system translocase SecA2 [Corynebacterium diphtheriae bv. mitis]MBG9361402.1 accessory Sec system translocase SecA2 [Corynebacterium diphtheriae bv. mitis]MBG9363567.1 accessory Sec system translocase SecA2 [Corynebacterium diphtheriae bv. mitis]MBG9365865.1 accessory Sec system translocase SecA2 [Corynebacterium diphtheriae bv. mitis]MCM0017686.1 accessory Sec system translocase SecA2 [Corynebact